ncbi:hypothetical protein J3A83DRAFT_38321 [Scleroderma citrinum]
MTDPMSPPTIRAWLTFWLSQPSVDLLLFPNAIRDAGNAAAPMSQIIKAVESYSPTQHTPQQDMLRELVSFVYWHGETKSTHDHVSLRSPFPLIPPFGVIPILGRHLNLLHNFLFYFITYPLLCYIIFSLVRSAAQPISIPSITTYHVYYTVFCYIKPLQERESKDLDQEHRIGVGIRDFLSEGTDTLRYTILLEHKILIIGQHCILLWYGPGQPKSDCTCASITLPSSKSAPS